MKDSLKDNDGEPRGTLVVIDMQPMFVNDERQAVIPLVCALVRKWMAADLPVLLLEFIGCGATVEQIRMELNGYAHQGLVRKDDRSGAREVIDGCRRQGFDSNNLVLCGVAYGCCVSHTARELLQLNPVAAVSIRVDCTDAYELDRGFRNYLPGVKQLG